MPTDRASDPAGIRPPPPRQVNDVVFAHGGLLPSHLRYGLQRINDEVSAWMSGVAHEDGSSAQPPFPAMGDSNSVMWNRTFGKERVNDCERRRQPAGPQARRRLPSPPPPPSPCRVPLVPSTPLPLPPAPPQTTACT